MEANATSSAGLTATAEQPLRLVFAGVCGLILLVGLLANGLMLLVVGRGPGAPRPLLSLTNSLMVNITLSDLLFLACVVPVLLLSFLRRDWWLGPTVCTTSQAANSATMFCTFYSMVATALLRHVAVAWPGLTWPSRLARVPAGCSVGPCGPWASWPRSPPGCSSEQLWRRGPGPASCS